MSAITAKASRKMKKYAVLTREPRCFLGSFDFSWEQRKFSDITFPAGEKNKDNLPLESYSITNEHGFVPQDEKFENGGTMREADKRMYYIVSPNSFAYNPARINVGSIGYQNIGKNVIVSSLYEVFKTSEDVDDRLLWHWFKSPDFQKLIMQLQEGGVRLYFYYDKLCMGEVSLPSLEEQRKIGKLFNTLDNLITLHQRKCVFLFGFFQAFISMIFTASTFSWEQRKAKELFVSTADKGYPELPVLSATQDRGMIRRDENSINIFHDKKNEAGYKRVLPGQFVIHLRSFQGGFAHSAIEGITSPAYTVFGFSEPEKHNSEYWKYVFTSKSFIRRLETVTYGIRDGRSISYEEFLTLDFVYPSKAEQTAIARYLDKLSNLITLHQRECISFTARAGRLILTANKKRNTSSWEQRKLGDIASDMVAGGDIDKDLILAEGQYPVIANALTGDGIVGYYDKEYRVNAPAVTVTGRGDVGHAKARLVNFTPVVRLLSVKSEHDVFFLENAINTLKIVIESTGVPQLTVPQLAKYEVAFPRQLDEEEHIGAFFKQLDHLITLHQRKPFLMKWRTSDANRNQTNRLVL